MLAKPVAHPIPRLPFLMVLPLLTVLGLLAASSQERDPIWPTPQALAAPEHALPTPDLPATARSAPSCVMMLTDIGPPTPAAGCQRQN